MNYPITRLLILLGFLNIISSIECRGPELVYIGENCDCPKELSYQVHVPCACKQKTHSGKQYPYSVIVPPRKSEHHDISRLNFDVQIPRSARPQCDKLDDLYAKVDRIVIKNEDCHRKYHYSPSSCQQCIYGQRSYRHIRPATAAGTKRTKRDLNDILLGAWKKINKKRSPSYMKIYQTKLPSSSGQMKKSLFSNLFDTIGINDVHTGRTKRDIMGEYATMKKEEENIDWTSPDITQFMPETLKAGFDPKVTFCSTGCQSCQQNEVKTKNHIKPRQSSYTETDKTTLNSEKSAQEEEQHHQVADPTANLYSLPLSKNADLRAQKELQNTNPINEAMSQIAVTQPMHDNAQSAFPTTEQIAQNTYDNLGHSYPADLNPLLFDDFYFPTDAQLNTEAAKENLDTMEMLREPLVASPYWTHDHHDPMGHLIRDILNRNPAFVEGRLGVFEQDKYNLHTYKDILEDKFKKYTY